MWPFSELSLFYWVLIIIVILVVVYYMGAESFVPSLYGVKPLGISQRDMDARKRQEIAQLDGK